MPPDVFRYVADGWGAGELWLQRGRLVWHELPRGEGEAGPGTELGERLCDYFRGERASFDDVDLDLDGCTPFQRAVTEALRKVAWGEVVTYGELAALSGHPGAQRAAGSFCARNGVPIVVPCHRVVAAAGIGPYGSLGVEYKRRLLRLEGQRV